MSDQNPQSIEKTKLLSNLSLSESETAALVSEINLELDSAPGLPDLAVFISTRLSCYIKALLDRKYFLIDSRSQSTVNTLFESAFKFCLQHLSKEHQGCLESIKRLLHDEKNFYDNRYNLYPYQAES